MTLSALPLVDQGGFVPISAPAPGQTTNGLSSVPIGQGVATIPAAPPGVSQSDWNGDFNWLQNVSGLNGPITSSGSASGASGSPGSSAPTSGSSTSLSPGSFWGTVLNAIGTATGIPLGGVSNAVASASNGANQIFWEVGLWVLLLLAIWALLDPKAETHIQDVIQTGSGAVKAATTKLGEMGAAAA